MLNKYAKALFSKLLTPFARMLLRIGLSPDAVTAIGTLGVMAGALVLYPLGQLFAGTVVITVFAFSDMVDGLMARLSGRKSTWGAFLDSTLDRVGDAVIFLGLAIWFFGAGANTVLAVLALAALVLGFLVPYARARAEGLGVTGADVGIAERPERLLLTLVATGLVGLGVTQWLLVVVLVVLAAASALTVVQRSARVYKQSTAHQLD